MGKVRVLETIRQGLIGGGESHVLDLVQQLDRDKYEPIVLSFTDGQMVTRLRKMGIKCHVIYTEKAFDISKWGQVKKLISTEKIDIVHAHGTRANTNIFWAAGSLGIPVVYTIHGWSFHDDQPKLVKYLRVLSEKFLTSKAKCNISVSLSNFQTGKKYFSGLKSAIINNGINLSRFNPHNPFRDIRAEYNIPKDVTLVGYIVRITKQKDPLTLIRAFGKVLEKREDLRLLMIGDGELKPQAISLAKGLGISDYIYFDSFREEVPDILNAIDIYCLPSLWEGLSIGLLEAMAMEKAIIATKVDGSKEVIRHGENGILINPQDVEGLAGAILKLHTDTALREKLSWNAHETISKDYNAMHMARSVEAIYHQAVP